MVRAIGIDLGSKRIGVSLSNTEGTLATPFDTVVRTGDMGRDHRAIKVLVDEAEAEVVVVGLPLSLDGTDGPQAIKYRKEAIRMAKVVGVPVEVHDERFTTVTADSYLMEADLDSRQRRKVIDKVAATVMLQDWLDAARARRT
ncbi:MAG: Holliday junction resolvase RuvX [Actinomycetia bacterium]|nr:Holliday junction resolvase RuvX [Actinomycetes bacterium]MCP4958886.1 Holliday junction resolvase RuvX [Actinomycetes bacterium]